MNENQIRHTKTYAAKTRLRGKFITINAYIKNKKDLKQITYLYTLRNKKNNSKLNSKLAG